MSHIRMKPLLTGLLLTLALGAPLAAQATGPQTPLPALKDVFKGDFLIGAALNAAQIMGRDTVADAIVTSQFNTISPENCLKWSVVNPQPGVYEWAVPDRYVEFGEQHHMFIVGHNLVWHSQVPRSVFTDSAGNPVGRDTLLARMRAHIFAVVGRYKGRINGWDVVNEALSEDGSLRQSQWQRIIGDDYIEKAFQYAHEADPSAQLYYNDYNLENAPKRAGAVALVKSLQAAGVPITGVGIQEHVRLGWPTAAQLDSTISAFADLGVKVMITELDVDVLPRAMRQQTADVGASANMREGLNPFTAGLPDSMQAKLGAQYAELFRVYLKHRGEVTRVTFWNVTDGESWLNNFPVRGRTNYPLLFDREGKPKPAFFAVVDAARQARN